MAERIPQSVTIRVPLKAYLSSDHISKATGKTIAVVISKNGGAFANPSAGATNATEIAQGWYYVDLSTTDTGTTGPLIVRGTEANCDDIEIAYNVVNAHNAGFDGVPNAAAEASGGLYTRGTGAGQIAQQANGQIDVNLSTIKTQAVTCAAGVTVLASVGTASTSTAQTGDSFARLGAPVGASISADIAGVQADTDNIQTRLPAALVSGRMDSSVGAMAADTLTASALATDAVTEIQTGLSTLTAAGVRSAVGLASANLDTQLAALQSDADNIQTRLPAALVSGRMDASVGAMASDTLTAAALATDAVTEIQSGLSTLNAAGVRSAVGLASANLDTQLSGIQSDTDDIQTRLPAALVGGRMDANVGAMGADTLTSSALATSAVSEIQSGLSTLDAAGVRTAVGLATANLDTQLAGINAKTTNLPSDPADASDIAAAFGTVNTTLGTIAGYVDTEVASIKTTVEAVKAKTDNLPASPAATGDAMTLTSDYDPAKTAAQAGDDMGVTDAGADAILDRTDGVETGVTLRQAQRATLAVVAGKSNGVTTTTAHFRDTNDTKNRITATLDANGNRTAVTTDLN